MLIGFYIFITGKLLLHPLAAINLLDYERLVNFGHLPTLDSSCINIEPDFFYILFENINVKVFLEGNFMDLGIKLSLKEYNGDHNILNDQDIVALGSIFIQDESRVGRCPKLTKRS